MAMERSSRASSQALVSSVLAALALVATMPAAQAFAQDSFGEKDGQRILISDQFNNRVIEVTHAGKIVFQQGKTNVIGDGFNELNGPYDAKRIGDFTGLTPPL